MKAPSSPDFGVRPPPAAFIGADHGPLAGGGALMHRKGCLDCHDIDGHGAIAAGSLSEIGRLRGRQQFVIGIASGGHNTPAFAGTLTTGEMNLIVRLLETRGAGRQ